MKEERKVTGNIVIEGARLIFRNFRGEAGEYNAPGNRNFGVILDDDLAEQLARDGWNVKYRKPMEDDPEQYRQPWLNVRVRFNPYPPLVFLINSKGKIRLDESTIGQLDWTRYKNCDLVIRPYNYPERPGRPAGVSAYLKAIYVTIQEDPLTLKYEDIPDLDMEESEE